MDRFTLGASALVVAALAAPANARAEDVVDPTTVGIFAQRRIGNVGWGLTGGTAGFGHLGLRLEAVRLRGTLGPHHRHFTTVGAADATVDFRANSALRRLRLQGLDTLVLYNHDHIGYYAHHETEWGGTPDRTSHLGEAGFAFHFFDDPDDPYTGYAAVTFGLGWDSLDVDGVRESGLVVPVGLRVHTDPIAAAWLEARAQVLARIHGEEGNAGGRLEATGRLRVHRGGLSEVSIVTTYRAVIEPKRFEDHPVEHIGSAGMEGSF